MAKANIVGPVIRAARNKAGLTQAGLVARLGILGWHLTRGTLAKVESGVRGVSDAELFLFAKALRKATDDLYPRDMGEIAGMLNQADA